MIETATLGGGCFWCTEAALKQLDGIVAAVPGYCGGHSDNPDYRSVCAGDTGHAEVVRFTYDGERIDYRTLLQAFFSIHDPTTRDRQGTPKGKPVTWRALVTVYVAEVTPQTTDEQLRNNPLSVYVRDYSWSRIQ